MDVEARKKFCGLLMFDSPTSQKSPTSQNFIDISSRGVDPSAMGYYSQNNFIPLQDSHMQDFNKSHALAAGAAAGDEQQNDNNGGQDRQSSSQSQPRRTPRPPNAFILYRRAKQPAIIASQRHLTNAEVSRQISDMWKSESEETRLEWERYADRKKLEHMKQYPDYVYRPVKNKKKSEKVDKRRQQRRKEAAAANESKSVGNGAVSTTGPVRRRSKPVPNSPTRLDLSAQNFFPSIITSNLTTRTDTAHPILPSQPEIPLMASPAPLDEMHTTHFPDMSSIPSTNTTTSSTSSSVSPITPISPPQLGVQSMKVNRQPSVYHELAYSTGGHNTPIPFQSIDGSYGGYQNLDFCVIPDVYRSHRQVLDDYMLHHNISTPTSPTDTSNIYVETGEQFYHTNGANGNGQPSYTDLLANLDVNDFLGGSANQQVAYLQ
jgi:hypothetical protein